MWRGDERLGTLTSGNFSPVLARGIGLGLFDPQLAEGDAVTVRMRGREVAAHVCALPFVAKER